jgi:hypothetical protein
MAARRGSSGMPGTGHVGFAADDTRRCAQDSQMASRCWPSAETTWTVAGRRPQAAQMTSVGFSGMLLVQPSKDLSG